MFANSYQSGFISIFYSVGSNPLALWDKQVKNGHIRRIMDDDVKSLVLEISGTNVATTYITCPIKPRASLGIRLPFLIMIIKNMKKYFTFEIQILDDKDMRRRFRISNFQSSTKVRPFCTTMPMGLSSGWNQVQFNLADFTKRAYGTTYMETMRVQVHANVCIRRIYFTDTLYTDDDLPAEFKLFGPIQKKKEEKKPSKEQLVKHEEEKPAEEIPPPPSPVDAAGTEEHVEEAPSEPAHEERVPIPEEEDTEKVRVSHEEIETPAEPDLEEEVPPEEQRISEDIPAEETTQEVTDETKDEEVHEPAESEAPPPEGGEGEAIVDAEATEAPTDVPETAEKAEEEGAIPVTEGEALPPPTEGEDAHTEITETHTEVEESHVETTEVVTTITTEGGETTVTEVMTEVTTEMGDTTDELATTDEPPSDVENVD
ncbi:fibrous sheath CABYR-binding protein-like [Diabrotica virgifera virgifera]|uniref:Fibrous sheath CABYR-binding protein-like n=1 Tax=Diabrotica virgifera virgifera TaxID=50390 RepID=A0A6P7EYS1_DIAVI|nr:fibrous sheath CABYR-binding protein-like [Diabrotica virgifera virgifera]